MDERINHKPIVLLLMLLLAVKFSSSETMAQSAQPAPRQRPPRIAIAPKPLSVSHLYWHFLVYLNHLDTKAAEADSQGKDGSMMRHYLQQQLGFTDAEFAPIRASSARLAANVKSLDEQAKAIQARGPSSSSSAQLQALTLQREASINAEVSTLRQTLAPDKTQAFEKFLAKLFSLANAVPRPAPVPPSSAAVQP